MQSSGTVLAIALNRFSHADLVEIAYRWVLNNARCGIAFKEMVCSAGEIPDVIGFGTGGHSVLVEVKVNRGDFLSDKKKMFRQFPEQGMGKFRYYCCPVNLIDKRELPENWGLIYVNQNGRAKRIQEATPVLSNKIAENSLMYAVLRRLNIRGLMVNFQPDKSGFIYPAESERKL